MRKGQILTLEHRQKLRASMIGRTFPRAAQHNAKIAQSLREYNLGLSDEEKRVRYSRPGFAHSDETREILRIQAVTNRHGLNFPRQVGANAWNWISDRDEAVRRKNVRYACRNLLKRVKDGSVRASRELGYSTAQLREHIEMQFHPGMNWSNWGEWHIDHIRPVSDFPVGATLQEINALSNLRPLWAAENLGRTRKISKEIES